MSILSLGCKRKVLGPLQIFLFTTYTAKNLKKKMEVSVWQKQVKVDFSKFSLQL